MSSRPRPFWRGFVDLAREHDRAGAGPEDRPAARARTREAPPPRAPPRRTSRASWTRRPGGSVRAARRELARPLRLEALDADLRERLPVRLEVALERQDGDRPRLRLRDRITIRASGAAPPREGSPPRSPSCPTPSDSSASRAPAASRQCVVALTIARARFSGSSDLKMPEPTKIASAPSDMQSAASAGVAMPPAAKFGTGSLPVSATCDDELERRLEALGLAHAARPSTSASDCASRGCTSRRCLTAWTTSPVPASPLVRIIAAPSPMRRSASPRLRQPQTNGTLKSCL